ncbi:hypothetical protein AVEN_157854-1 [Araneus ventricosus]|uniref:DUF5641 domain-containing protein n=1 Tax=Araneus ventricosus TaxID=182803 RepID=A0A4Y2E627_ARAVE|nr:hypothetical protein AVEN_157854-1 [Araneus ventricosus]
MILNDINIKRCIVIQGTEVTELHDFCDGSEKAYGAAINARNSHFSWRGESEDSREGRPNDIFCDKGTNFVGANNELRKILKGLFKRESAEQCEDFLASEGIKWHFNLPATPHFGGFWDAGVKSLKDNIKGIVGNAILTHEEFFTPITQVEAVLNSRPLCPLFEDHNDDLAFTTAHFLVGTSLTSFPEPHFKETSLNRLSRWELVQKLAQMFWSKWISDNLNRLPMRPKLYKGEKKFKENEIVLVKGDDDSKLLCWNLTKIIEVNPWEDDITRQVKVSINDLLIKLLNLPFDSN